ncbi:hypothetical protein EYF80_010484 [Liparis tanakae]|uniref:Uncharacterized protein n=1 Tax=Liparis tanakae TaxID=230148 RepID=A0A4Z2IMJ8_9TELE|nr:hypothetical protein EYF80_010484 [Liparis tanakae]
MKSGKLCVERRSGGMLYQAVVQEARLSPASLPHQPPPDTHIYYFLTHHLPLFLLQPLGASITEPVTLTQGIRDEDRQRDQSEVNDGQGVGEGEGVMEG